MLVTQSRRASLTASLSVRDPDCTGTTVAPISVIRKQLSFCRSQSTAPAIFGRGRAHDEDEDEDEGEGEDEDEDATALSARAARTHVDDTLEVEQRARGSRRHAVLPCASLRDDALLAQLHRKQRLPY